ncbi:thaumatin-like protein 1b isoform X1 [Tripterygium wilfordii]|uniref:thaumatin-like protein 1b isoform X1 n=1 Tax=Tripterygium wilfordii TaxID=458696 RepID=UPI0018F8555F|nr:thaumatin-like protein 1b isoform X1 [Tripterygium wilfordii]
MDRRRLLSVIVLTLLSISHFSEVQSATFKIVNKCRNTIWPGLLSGANTAQLSTTGFALEAGKSKTIPIPRAWSGRIWARTHCSRDSAGKFVCATADCGSGNLACGGSGAKPPATLAEFTLNGAGGLDFYDVSLVDGYNLPVLVVPKKITKGLCGATGCLIDLNGACPAELRVARENGSASVACRSACEAFGDPSYCCSGAYSTPDTCPPSPYSLFFKNACPRAYSYAYDDKTSTYTCASANYVIIFCPPPYTSQKLLGARQDGAQLPLVNKTTIYIASHHANAASSSGPVQAQFIAGAASSVVALLLFWPLLFNL